MKPIHIHVRRLGNLRTASTVWRGITYFATDRDPTVAVSLLIGELENAGCFAPIRLEEWAP